MRTPRIPTDPQCKEDLEDIAKAAEIVQEMKESGEFSWNELLWQDKIAEALIEKDKQIRKLKREVIGGTFKEPKMRTISELIEELKSIHQRFGNTCVWGGPSWGSIALWDRIYYEDYIAICDFAGIKGTYEDLIGYIEYRRSN